IAIQLAPVRRIFIVSVDYGYAGRAQSAEDFTLGASDALARTHLSKVCDTSIRDQRNAGARQASQLADLAAMVHSHFNYRVRLPLTQRQHNERDAEVVV